jgi:hypothetical protein
MACRAMPSCTLPATMEQLTGGTPTAVVVTSTLKP